MALRFYLLTFILISLVFSSCSDDDGGTNAPENTLKLGKMEAKIDGSSWSSMTSSADHFVDGVYIVGISMFGKTIKLTLPEKNPGSYSDGEAEYIIPDMSNPGNFFTYSASNVQYKITRYENEEIAGTFSFTAKVSNGSATKSITEGKFNLKLED